MSRAGKLVVAASVIWLVIAEAIAAHRTNYGMLFLLPFSLGFLGVMLYGLQMVFTEWRKRWGKAAIPFGVCAVSIIIFIPLGRMVSAALFAWALPSYETIVRGVETGRTPVSVNFTTISNAERQARLTQRVDAQKNANGVVTVLFWTEYGFPAFHSGYLYSSADALPSGWPIAERVRSNWFFISN